MSEQAMATAGQFRKYDHLERLKHPDVADLSFGTVHVFPKIDGTNASIWASQIDPDIGPDYQVLCGSRSRTLSESADNAGFHAWVHSDDERAIALRAFVMQFPHLTVYGEWLVPHTLKTYRDDAWRRFYVFDVYSHLVHKYIEFSAYAEHMEKMGIDVIHPLAIIENPSDNQLAGIRDTTNTFLIQDDAGTGEGIVLKNYDWSNKFGRQPWGKLVRNEFKEDSAKVFGLKVTQGAKQVEQEIVTDFCTPEFIRKEFAKVVQAVANEAKVTFTAPDPLIDKALTDIAVEAAGMTPNEPLEVVDRDQFIEVNRHKILPRFLGTVYLTFIEEEIRAFVKQFKNPVVDFSKLQKLVTLASKATMREVF